MTTVIDDSPYNLEGHFGCPVVNKRNDITVVNETTYSSNGHKLLTDNHGNHFIEFPNGELLWLIPGVD